MGTSKKSDTIAVHPSNVPGWIPKDMVQYLPESLEVVRPKTNIQKATAHESPGLTPVVTARGGGFNSHEDHQGGSQFKQHHIRPVNEGPTTLAQSTWQYSKAAVDSSHHPQDAQALANLNGHIRGTTTVNNPNSLATKVASRHMSRSGLTNFVQDDHDAIQRIERKNELINKKKADRWAANLPSNSEELALICKSRGGFLSGDSSYEYAYSYYSSASEIDADAIRARGGASVDSSEQPRKDIQTQTKVAAKGDTIRYRGKDSGRRRRGGDESSWGSIPAEEKYMNQRKGSIDVLPDWQQPHKVGEKLVKNRKGCC